MQQNQSKMIMHMKRSRYVSEQYKKIKRDHKDKRYHKLNQSMDMHTDRTFLAAPLLINEQSGSALERHSDGIKLED